MIYLKKFANHQEYADAESSGLLLPNISVCVNEHDVHYNPYVPPRIDIITYKASAKLEETTNTYSNGLHTNAFSGTSGQLTMISHTFENGVGTIEFDGDVVSIGTWAFHGCTGLTNITIPSSVTRIGDGAFRDCTVLTNIDIPSGVTSISNEAFRACSGLISVTISDSVTNIGSDAFTGCTGLTSITSNATTAPTINGYTFQNVKSGGTLYVPSGSTGYDAWIGYLNNWTKVEQ